MKQKITIGMPVKSYLKKYVYWKENLKPDEILDLHPYSKVRMVLDSLLTGKMQLYSPQKNNGSLIRDLNDEILCRVTPHKQGRQLIFFGKPQINWFNNFLYQDLHDDLLYAIMLNKLHGIGENKTIHAFMDGLGIENDISFDGLKKSSYRRRKHRNLPVFRLQSSRQASNPFEFIVLPDFEKN